MRLTSYNLMQFPGSIHIRILLTQHLSITPLKEQQVEKSTCCSFTYININSLVAPP